MRAGCETTSKGLSLEGSVIEGMVRLLGADITGPLSCRNAKLTGTDGPPA